MIIREDAIYGRQSVDRKDSMPIADRTLLVNKDKYRMHILPFGKEIAQ